MKMNKSKFFHQIRKKCKCQAGLISLFAAFIVLSRYGYIFYLGDNDVEGNFFGFTWLSIFLYSIGVEISYLSFALVLAYATRFMDERTRKPFLFLAYVISFVGFFFISWVLLGDNGYSTHQEILFSFIAALLIIIAIYFLSKFLSQNQESIEKLKSKIRFVMHKMIIESVSNNHVSNRKKWEEEIVEPTLDKLNE